MKLTCLCKQRVVAVELYGHANKVPIASCSCGVKRSHGELVDAGAVLLQYSSGSYHESTDRHANVVPYAERYANDLAVAKIRADKYNDVIGSVGPLVLDVGAANGAFVDYLRNEEYVEAWGIEPDPRFAREHIVTGTIHTAELEHSGFDVITYHDVLEHIVDPREEVIAAAGKLNEGGTLILDVPDVQVPAGMKHYKAEHLWYFTLRSLVDLILEAQLELSRVDFPIPGKLVVYAHKPWDLA